MRASLAIRFFAAVGFAGAATGATGAGGPSLDSDLQWNIDYQIARLDAAKPADREDAAARLANFGTPASASARLALATASPQQKQGLELVLLHVPWTSPNEDADIAEAFQNYATLTADARRTQLVGALRVIGKRAVPAWFRVLVQDPSASVRWEAARYVSYYVDDDLPLAHRLTEMTAAVGRRPTPLDPAGPDVVPIDQNAPLLAVAGWAQRGTHAGRATELIARAIERERTSPSAFNGQAAFAFTWLIDRATTNRDFAAAVVLYRQQAATTEIRPDVGLDSDIGTLFALHAAYGPFPGFREDLRTYKQIVGTPEFAYATAVLADRRGAPLTAALIRRAALLSSGTSVTDHFRVGTFCTRQHWDDDAERELNYCLTLPDVNRFTIDYALVAVDLDRDDDASHAAHLEAALADANSDVSNAFTNKFGKPVPWSSDLTWGQVHWHYLRAARLAGDAATVRTRLDKLMFLDQEKQILDEDPSMASDVVPALESVGRKSDADRVFDHAYQALKKDVDDSPDNPMPKNNLAWLCVETGRHLDEALRLATEAAADNPFDADTLDTQAECLSAVGRLADAAEVETRAAVFKPQSKMIATKAARYRDAARRVSPR
jgi:tetratricopeptide (TPR) repeat protein